MDDVDAVQAQIRAQHAGLRRLGDGAAGRHGLSGESAADLLDDRRLLQSIRRARLGGAAFHCAFGHGLCWLTAAFGMWAFGGEPDSTPAVHGDVRRAVSVHAHSDSGRDADVHGDAGDVGAAARARRRRAASAMWAFLLAASLGTGLLLKSLIGVLFPVAAGLIYLCLTHSYFPRGPGSGCISSAEWSSCC